MDSATELLLDSYSKLVALFQKQLDIAAQDRYDDQLSQLQELEKEKKVYQNNIEQISSDATIYEPIINVYRETIMVNITELQGLNNALQLIITSWYEEDSKTMKQVSVQRKTLQGYGGVNDVDVISFYFDEKR